jgi:acetyl esterase
MASARELDPEVSEMLEMMEQMGVPPLSALSVDGARSLASDLFAREDDPEAVGNVQDLSIAGPEKSIPIRIYTPESERTPHPVLVYFHGGGWVLGDIEMTDDTCRAIVNEAGCIVVSVDYRLAPEHEFPAAVEDCYAATQWVANNADVIDADSEKIAVGGDSAGGNTAAAVAQLARDRGGPSLVHQLLAYPVTNHSFETDSMEENAEGYFLTRADMEWFWELYLRDDIDGRNPYASPLQAHDLTDLPSATVVTAGFDPLRDEGQAYADRLRDADVDVEQEHYSGAIHDTILMLAEPELESARGVISDVSNSLQNAFAE